MVSTAKELGKAPIGDTARDALEDSDRRTGSYYKRLDAAVHNLWELLLRKRYYSSLISVLVQHQQFVLFDNIIRLRVSLKPALYPNGDPFRFNGLGTRRLWLWHLQSSRQQMVSWHSC
jgi:hypothetical protein